MMHTTSGFVLALGLVFLTLGANWGRKDCPTIFLGPSSSLTKLLSRVPFSYNMRVHRAPHEYLVTIEPLDQDHELSFRIQIVRLGARDDELEKDLPAAIAKFPGSYAPNFAHHNIIARGILKIADEMPLKVALALLHENLLVRTAVKVSTPPLRVPTVPNVSMIMEEFAGEEFRRMKPSVRKKSSGIGEGSFYEDPRSSRTTLPRLVDV